MSNKTKRISERGVELRLINLLQGDGGPNMLKRLEVKGGSIRTFEEAGLLTRDKGLVLDLPNGQTFNLTIQCDTRR